MGIFDNPWFIGIGGGVLSGFLVTLITRYLFSRRDNREYVQKVVTANQEVLYAIRPGISEGAIPSQDVLRSLIGATARKYSVDQTDLYDTTTFADVLIKEVMDSSFLPASSKADFCNRLSELKPAPRLETPPPTPRSVPAIADYRRRMVTMMSGMLGVMAALMTVSVAFTDILGFSKTELRSKDLVLILPTALTILVAFVATYAMWMFRYLDRKRREDSEGRKPNKEYKDDEKMHNN